MVQSFQTMVLIENREGKFLLGKKLQKIGAGKYNGPGGKVNVTEDQEGSKLEEKIKSSAVREVREETTLEIEADNLERAGVLKIKFEGGEKEIILYVYKIKEFSGTPQVSESEEEKIGSWDWYSKEEILEMIEQGKFMEADATWMPEVLEGKEVRGYITYEKLDDEFRVKKAEIKEVDSEHKIWKPIKR